MSKNKLSICILALNEEKKIENCLNSLKDIAEEIIVGIDDNTTDKTSEIASRFTKKIFKCRHRDSFDINKNLTIDKAKSAWILLIDADEEVTQELGREIIRKINSNNNPNNAYFIPRKNYIFKKWIRYTGWYPDYQLRLFKKDTVKFVSDKLHENPEVKKPFSYLKNPLTHDNYQSVSQFVERLNRYTSVDAQDYVKKLKPPYYKHFIARPMDEFIKRFLAWRGYKDGLHGLVLSLLQAFYELVVVAKAWERKKFEKEKNLELIKNIEHEAGKAVKNWHWWKNELEIKKSSNLVKKTWLKGLRKLGL